MISIFSWLRQLFLKWIWALGLLPTLIDFISTYVPSQYIPQTVGEFLEKGPTIQLTLSLTLIGVVVSAYLIYVDDQNKIKGLSQKIITLQAEEANIILHVERTSFTHARDASIVGTFGGNDSGFEINGRPKWATLYASICARNLGRESGSFDYHIDRRNSNIPPFFELEESSDGRMNTPTREVQPRSSRLIDYHLALKIHDTSQDIAAFAKLLQVPHTYKIVLAYATTSISGKGEERHLAIEGNLDEYAKELLGFWNSNGYIPLSSQANHNKR